jgi:diaminohydroxyphosphoribosylaminopyrimidine deaminase / 5-amino-6-(5-phosphoribosylamino)uracil reductase
MSPGPPRDHHFMKLALREAVKGMGRTSPNPLVGAVVVKQGEVVGKGYHQRAGTPHAEVHALRAAGGRASGATLYVTLEPCNHTGRTPPCTEAILQAGIQRVVVGMADPNPNVTGGGSNFLAARGVELVQGVLADECREINLPFIKHSITGLPWVIMKAGASLDGRIATSRGASGWITNQQSRREVHRLRNRVDAILVGIDTVFCDDPALTTRLERGRGRDPLRVVMDANLRMPPAARMLHQDSDAVTWIFCGPRADTKKMEPLAAAGAVIKTIPETSPGQLDLHLMLAELGKAGLNTLLVEGGGRIHGAFLQAGMADDLYMFMAPCFLGADGVPVVNMAGIGKVADAPRVQVISTRRFGGDLLVVGRFVHREGPEKSLA